MATAEQILAELEKSFSSLHKQKAIGKFLLYGNSGTSKTVTSVALAAKIIEPGKEILYIDACEGWVSLLNHSDILAKVKIRRAVYQGAAHLENLCKAVLNGIGTFNNVGAIILDEYSSMARMDVEVVVSSRSAKDSSKDPDIASFTDTGSSTRRMDRITNLLLEVSNHKNVHLIFVAHERKDKDRANIEVNSPAFMPAFNGIVKANMHVVGRFTADETVDSNGNPVYRRKIQVHPSRTVNAKSRIGGLPVNVSIPNFIDTVSAFLQGSGIEELEERVPINDIPVEEDFGGIVAE